MRMRQRLLCALLAGLFAGASHAQALTEIEKRMPSVSQRVEDTFALEERTWLVRRGYTCRRLTKPYLSFLAETIAEVKRMIDQKQRDSLLASGLSSRAIINRSHYETIDRWQARLPEWEQQLTHGPGIHNCQINHLVGTIV